MNTKALGRKKKIWRCKQQKIYRVCTERQGWILQATGNASVFYLQHWKIRHWTDNSSVSSGSGQGSGFFAVGLTKVLYLIQGPAPQLWLLADTEEVANQRYLKISQEIACSHLLLASESLICLGRVPWMKKLLPDCLQNWNELIWLPGEVCHFFVTHLLPTLTCLLSVHRDSGNSSPDIWRCGKCQLFPVSQAWQPVASPCDISAR